MSLHGKINELKERAKDQTIYSHSGDHL